MSHLNENEINELQTSSLHRRTPFMICGVSTSMFSVARHYGGATFNGDSYTYVPTTDELIRDDVVKWLAKQRKTARKR